MKRRPPRSTRTEHTLSLHDALPISDTMIDVGDEIARLEVAEFFQCNGLGPGVPSPRPVFIIAIENLVICITGRLQVQVSKRSEEHTSELQSLMRISYAVFCLKKKKICMTNVKYK